jgi:hypothetical protein
MPWEPYDPERDGPLRGGASNDPDDPMFAHEYGGGIPQAQAARIADAIMADTTAPPSDGPKPGPRRNRHLDGFGGRQNA